MQFMAGMTLLGCGFANKTLGTWLEMAGKIYPKGRREDLLDANGVGEGSRGDCQAHSDLRVG